MSLKFTIQSKAQSKKRSISSPAVSDDSTSSGTDSPSKIYISEFNSAEAPPIESTVKLISPVPNHWLQNLSILSQTTRADSPIQFELDPVPNAEHPHNSMNYGLNIRQRAEDADGDVPMCETLDDLELRKLREDLKRLPDDCDMADFEGMPVEGFGVAVLKGYGWEEGRGIGRNAKEDVKVAVVKKKLGRGGLGFTGVLPGKHIEVIG